MGVIEFLQQYGEAARFVRQLQREYKDERDMIDAIRSPLGGDGTHGSGISRSVEDKATRLADKAADLRDAWDMAIEIRQEVYAAIKSVPGVASDVLYERYICLQSWDMVAKSVGYSRRHTLRLHSEGIDFLEKNL
jgi:hypothetical protein